MKNTKFDGLKLCILPIGLLLLSYLGLIAVKYNYANENAALKLSKLMESRLPTSDDQILLGTNTPPNEIKKDRLKKLQSKNSLENFKKPHNSISLEITSSQQEPIAANQEFELVGTISIEREVGPIEVTWHLPKGIEVLDPKHLHLTIYLQQGGMQRVTLTAFSRIQTNQQIHLEARYNQGSLKIGNTVQFNTIDQTRINKATLRQRKLLSLTRKNDSDRIEKGTIWQ